MPRDDKWKAGGELCKREWMAFLRVHPQHPRDTMPVYRYWLKYCWPKMVKQRRRNGDVH